MCQRNYYINRIKTIEPFDETEADEMRSAEEWINSGGAIFRDADYAKADDRHFVTYFPLVDFSSRSIFLVHHKKAGIWLPPGGHIEEGETPSEATIRECREELGIPARFISPRPVFLSSVVTRNTNDPHRDIAFWFLLSGSRNDHVMPDMGEFNEAKWFSLEDPLPSQIEENMLRFVEKIMHAPYLASARIRSQSAVRGDSSLSRPLATTARSSSLMPS
jgi:8-oxo-dGTP diphosphatase